MVTGWMRSGTSAMMQALIAGGLDPIYSEERERIMQKRKDANPRGWYELLVEQIISTQYLYENLVGENRCVKIPTIYLRNLPPRKMRLVWMHRDPVEVRKSFELAFPDQDFNHRFPGWPENYHYTTKAMRELMDDRKSVEVVDVQHSDLIADPTAALRDWR